MLVANVSALRTALIAELMAALALSSPALAGEVWIVTDRAHPVVGAPAGVRIILLDAPQQLTSTLSATLPADSERAATLARERLTANNRSLQTALAAAYQGVVDAWSLGITKVPAIVVDRRYALYGDSDAERALHRIEQFRQTKEK